MNITLKTLVMNFVQSRGSASRTDIVKFIHEVKGMPFNKYDSRGYWSSAFITGTSRITYTDHMNNVVKNVNTYSSQGYFMRPSSKESRYLYQEKPYGLYQVRS